MNDIRPKWLNVVRALQATASKNAGLGTITLRVIINGDGDPVVWTEPELVKWHPKSHAETMIGLISGQE